MNRYIIPDLSQIGESLKIAEEYGTAFEYNDFFRPNVLDDKEEQNRLIREYKALGRDARQDTMHGAFLDITIASYDKKIQEVSKDRVKRSLEIGERIGLKGVVFHTNYITNFLLDSYCNNWLKVNEEFWSEMLLEFPSLNIYMENMFDTDPVLIGRLAELMKEKERFGICFDYAHAALSHTSAKEWISALYPYIRHMHINDNNLLADLHQPVGRGKIDWAEYRILMEEYKLEPSVLIEVAGAENQRESIQTMIAGGLYPYNLSGGICKTANKVI